MNYDDILDMPHHVSTVHPQMSMHDRAAQFSPFAALTGHEAAIRETARLTNERIDLDENSRELLDERMQVLREYLKRGCAQTQHPSLHDQISVTYFVPDQKKAGGQYRTVTGFVSKLKEYEQELILSDGTIIPLTEIVALDGMMFGMLE